MTMSSTKPSLFGGVEGGFEIIVIRSEYNVSESNEQTSLITTNNNQTNFSSTDQTVTCTHAHLLSDSHYHIVPALVAKLWRVPAQGLLGQIATVIRSQLARGGSIETS